MDEDMRLVLVSPQNDTTLKITQALERDEGMHIRPVPYPYATSDLLHKPAPDAILMVGHPDIDLWITELTAMGWSGPYVVIAPPEDHDRIVSATHCSELALLTPEEATMTSFPALLRRAVQELDGARTGESGLFTDDQEAIAASSFVLDEALCEVMSSLTGSADIETVLDPVLAAVTSLIECDGADIRLVSGDEVRIAHAYSCSASAVPFAQEETGYSLQASQTLREVADNRRPFLVQDTAPYEGSDEVPGPAWARSQMAAPLLVDDDLVGFVTVSSASANAFMDGDLDVLETLAPVAAVALHNAYLYQSLSKERDQLMALAYIDQKILGMHDWPEDVISTILSHALRLLGLTKGIIILSSQGGRPESVYTLGLKDPTRTEDLIRSSWECDQAVFEEHGPGWHIALDHALTTPPQVVAWAEAEAVQALLSMPLWLRGSLVGCMFLLNTVAKPWSEKDLQIVRMLAGRITIAIDKALLEQQHRERLHDAEEAFLQLQRLDSMKNQFIQNTSHELRTPLAIVKGYVDLIIDGVIDTSDPEDLKPAMQAIQTYTDNLVALVESITTLEASEVGSLELTLQPIQPICRAAIRANWQQAHRRRIAILAEIPDDLPLVPVDAEGMSRALNQVLDNALKFSPPDSTIRLTAFQENGHLYVRVQDEGIGIPKAELERIFDRFYQVDGATTRRHGGMGLGLSLVKEMVQRHHGKVWADSPGTNLGTTISIELPIHPPRSTYEDLTSCRKTLRHEGEVLRDTESPAGRELTDHQGSNSTTAGSS